GPNWRRLHHRSRQSNPALCTVAHETIRRLKLPVDESAHPVPLPLELESISFGQIDHYQQAHYGPLSQIDRRRARSAFVLTDREIAPLLAALTTPLLSYGSPTPASTHHEDIDEISKSDFSCCWARDLSFEFVSGSPLRQ